MPKYSPSLPLKLSKKDGYVMNTALKDVVKQNLKMLLLTSPGERIMIPNFGVGIRRFLFEQSDGATFARVKRRVDDQVNTYMPFLTIVSVDFKTDDPALPSNTLTVVVRYTIPSINTIDELNLKIDQNQL